MPEGINCGIYVIRNLLTGKVYVGSSKRLEKRKYHHFYRLKKGIHDNFHLQNSYHFYGENNFVFELLESCAFDVLVERENWWIDFFDSRNSERGYNLCKADRTDVDEASRCKISAAHKGKIVSEETRAKISSSLKGRKLPESHRAKVVSALIGNTRTKGKSWSENRRLAQKKRERI